MFKFIDLSDELLLKKNIYIYGVGEGAKKLKLLLDEKGLKISGYITTNPPVNAAGDFSPVKQYVSNDFSENDVIIISVSNLKFFQEITIILQDALCDVYFIKPDNNTKENNNIKQIPLEERLYYFGDFSSYAEAERKCKELCGGYNAPNILQQVNEATQKVRAGKALYEQDGVCFYEPLYNYELLASLFFIKATEGKLNVLDFGGALGSTYYRYKNFWQKLNAMWNIVEQKHFVDCGKINEPEINFYYTIDEAKSEHNINVLLLSSVIQYLDDPYKWFENLCSKDFKYIILDETAFSLDENAKKQILLQHVPKSIYKAIYPVHLLGLKEFHKIINKVGYEIIWEWKYRFGSIPIKTDTDFRDTVDKGIFLKKRS